MSNNYKNLFLDFASNMNGTDPNQKPVFSPLEEQYSKLNIINKDDSMRDFLTALFFENEILDIHISHPSFNKQPRETKQQNKYYNNVAIRISISPEQDLVLMGDVMVRARELVNQSFFMIKSLIVMDSEIVHMGEFNLSCQTYVSFEKDRGRSQWESYEHQHFQPNDSEWSDTVFSEDFIDKLLKSYVVDKPAEVLKTLNEWDKYLEAREYILKENSKNGFSVQTDFFKGYVREVKKNQITDIENYDFIPFLKKSNNIIWVKTKIEGFEERVLGHIMHDVLEKEFEADEKYLKKYNGLTKSTVKLIDLSVSVEKRLDANLIFKFDDTRITVAEKEVIPPTGRLQELNENEIDEIKRVQNEIEKKLRKEIDLSISEFKNKELPELIDLFIQDQRDPFSKRVAAEWLRKVETDLTEVRESIKKAEIKLDETIKNVRKKHSNLEGEKLQAVLNDDVNIVNAKANLSKEQSRLNREQIESQYNFNEMLKAEILRLSHHEENRLLEIKRKELTQSLKSRFDDELNQITIDIKEKMNSLREDAKREGNIVRLHTYFEVPIDESSNADITLRDAVKAIEGHAQCFLTYDDSGDRTVLRRQKDALRKFREGYVMNPFLATALFCPAAGDRVSDILLETFYQENLNKIQKKAVESAVSSNGMFLIQGPPGTGKTQVIAEITTQLVFQGKKVLIASENNKAVDNAFSRLPKDPSIRPLRLVNDKKAKNNPYSLDYLLKNFYKNISKTLDGRIHNYENYESYKESYKEKMEDLKSRFNELGKLKLDIKNIDQEIKRKQKDLHDLEMQVRGIKTENNNKNFEISELKDQISQISNFRVQDEMVDSLLFVEKLRSIFEKSEIFIDGAGASELALRISKSNDSEIISQIARIKVHNSYFELIAQKSNAKPNQIAKLNEQITHYEEMNSISLSEFSLFELSHLESDDIIKLRTKLLNLRNNESDIISERINGLEASMNNSDSLERKIRILNNEIDELKEDEIYNQYTSFNGKLHSEVKKIFSELRISDPYQSDLSDVLEIIEDNWSLISKNSKKNESKNKKLVPIYKEISKYLTDDDVLKNDDNQYSKLLQSYVNVVGMTCTARESISDSEIDVNKMGIDVVIVDEVSKISFVELLQPILYGKTVILVGDHKQLAPMYSPCVPKEVDWSLYDETIITAELENNFKKIYEESFFKQLFQKTPDSSKVTLNIQYRMHPQIMEVDNKFYFDSLLEFGGKGSDKDHYLEVSGQFKRKIIRPDNHVIFIDCKGHERQESGSTSYSNEGEADVVKKMLDLINQNCKFDRNHQPIRDSSQYRKEDTRLSVGVICTYSDQAKLIRKNKTQKYSSFNDSDDDRFMVKTVDDFQGDERDIIILSMVRTDSKSNFLKEYRRINVAMSRARRLLIIVGNASVLSKMSVEIDSSTQPRSSKVYDEIIQTIKNFDGYRESENVLGEV
ncbi:hypothetical protein MmiHf6_02440 [Methanimicrococcus hongohii]|uniref:Uncharacterized protein n=1 Tax=Methanimicrococcus hongohii TaxID=3028295 RepID=A0AA96V0E7_9EURY|nr:AAA domain-containing protein [Methanimicrococcus sp. Hf6]WNY22950.1 hypothetical protein MmiHf6_02440 [Methanimicrococcus sp. Hf6]